MYKISCPVCGYIQEFHNIKYGQDTEFTTTCEWQEDSVSDINGEKEPCGEKFLIDISWYPMIDTYQLIKKRKEK